MWSKYKIVIQLAAASVILLLGITIGMKVNEDQNRIAEIESQMNEMRMAMISLMQEESVSKRIKGVNVSL